jgi:hypothetical protein
LTNVNNVPDIQYNVSANIALALLDELILHLISTELVIMQGVLSEIELTAGRENRKYEDILTVILAL